MFQIKSYISAEYLAVFLPGTLAVYAFSSQKARRYLLLLASYLMFWIISGMLLGYLLLATLTIYLIGLCIADQQRRSKEKSRELPKESRKSFRKKAQKRQKQITAAGVLVLTGILLVLKYGAFFVENYNSLLTMMRLPMTVKVPSFVLPIGISFYTMQGLSYLFDVYRKQIQAERNFARLALYMSFFPLLMEGPICRYSETAAQLWEASPLEWRNFLLGMERILWGVLKKVVVADRLNIMIKTVFDGYRKYDGFILAAGAVCYTIQLYMDFSGMIDLVAGTGQIFGIRLPENFRQPFFSKSIPEFWRRWHISLGAWFRDYIFYPMSFSEPLKRMAARGRKTLGSHYGVLPATAIALFCVWLCNGLWHGAGWNYIFFGMYHFTLILLDNLIKPPSAMFVRKLRINPENRVLQGLQIVRTSVLVCIGELFFRAKGLPEGMEMLRRVFTTFSLVSLRNRSFFKLGADKKDYIIVFITLCMVLCISIMHERGYSFRRWVEGKGTAARYALFYFLILYIIVFGAYGDGYVPIDPMYANF